jgi:hypothetical protein
LVLDPIFHIYNPLTVIDMHMGTKLRIMRLEGANHRNYLMIYPPLTWSNLSNVNSSHTNIKITRLYTKSQHYNYLEVGHHNVHET